MVNARNQPGYLAKLRANLAKSSRQLKKIVSPQSHPQPSHLSPRSSSSGEPRSLPDSVVRLVETNNKDQQVLRVVTTKRVHPHPPARQASRDGQECVPTHTATPSALPRSDAPAPVGLLVHSLGDEFTGTRVIMNHIGIDVGTKTIAIAYKGDDGKTRFLTEINGYWPFERATPFVENMLNDPKKKRSDGTERPARWLKLDNKVVVLGRDAEEFAYAKNDTLLRPMAEGGIAADEEAMTVLSAIIHGLLNMAELEVGKFGEEVKICYCTTAPAINKESNIEYHQRVVDMILGNYETKAKKVVNNIKESHAIVLDMSQDATGIGISWGAGTVTVSYVKYGMEVYSFCWVGAGDWIDTQVAMRHGYDPELFKTRKKVAKETPTTVSRRKLDVDLTPGREPEDRLGMDIVMHYDVLISRVIEGVVQGFQAHEAEARIEEGVNIFMAGGTSSPRGFVQRVVKKMNELELPFSVGEVKRSSQPLYSVADGLLKAAEMF